MSLLLLKNQSGDISCFFVLEFQSFFIECDLEISKDIIAVPQFHYPTVIVKLNGRQQLH